MELSDRIDLLNEAGDLIAQAIGNIEEALKGTSEEAHARAYIIPHLSTWIGNGNRYDVDVYKYIEHLERSEDERGDYDEDENEFEFELEK